MEFKLLVYFKVEKQKPKMTKYGFRNVSPYLFTHKQTVIKGLLNIDAFEMC